MIGACSGCVRECHAEVHEFLSEPSFGTIVLVFQHEQLVHVQEFLHVTFGFGDRDGLLYQACANVDLTTKYLVGSV